MLAIPQSKREYKQEQKKRESETLRMSEEKWNHCFSDILSIIISCSNEWYKDTNSIAIIYY
jgi:hypothetical protein